MESVKERAKKFVNMDFQKGKLTEEKKSRYLKEIEENKVSKLPKEIFKYIKRVYNENSSVKMRNKIVE